MTKAGFPALAPAMGAFPTQSDGGGDPLTRFCNRDSTVSGPVQFRLLNPQESESSWSEGRGGISRAAEFIGTDIRDRPHRPGGALAIGWHVGPDHTGIARR